MNVLPAKLAAPMPKGPTLADLDIFFDEETASPLTPQEPEEPQVVEKNTAVVDLTATNDLRTLFQ